MKISLFSNTKGQQIKKLEKENKQYKQVQELLVKDILTLQEVTKSYKGNEYQDYDVTIKAISDKYRGIADWGVLQTGIIIDLRAVFILGEGVKIVSTGNEEEAQREFQWVNDFFEYNDFDCEGFPNLAKEAEIEGKIALRMFYESEKYKDWPGMITARYISYLNKKYKVETDPKDYMDYIKLSWEDTGTTKGETLGPDKSA